MGRPAFGISYLIFVSLATSCKSTGSSSYTRSGALTPSGESLFDNNEVISLSAEAGFGKAIRDNHVGPVHSMNGPTTKNEFPLKIIYPETDGTTVSLSAKAKFRGAWTLLNCAFPKFKFKIDKNQLVKAPLFKDASNLKVGSHCYPGGSAAGDATHRESFIYHLVSILGMPAQKSKPAQINYVDTEENETFVKKAFLFEDGDLMAKRLGGKIIEADANGIFPKETFDRLDRNQVVFAHLLQIFIGNWDYSIRIDERRAQNIEMLALTDGRVLAIPSDFNFSTMVTGELADGFGGGTTNEKAAAEKFIQKRLLALVTAKQISKEELVKAAQIFSGKKENILSSVKTYPLDDEGRDNIRISVEAFYTVLPLVIPSL